MRMHSLYVPAYISYKFEARNDSNTHAVKFFKRNKLLKDRIHSWYYLIPYTVSTPYMAVYGVIQNFT
jgi:hypothetical protein